MASSLLHPRAKPHLNDCILPDSSTCLSAVRVPLPSQAHVPGMGEPSAVSAAFARRGKCASDQKHPAWRIDLPVRFDKARGQLARITTISERFLGQGTNGGTDNELRLIVGLLNTDMRTDQPVPREMIRFSGPAVGEPSSSSTLPTDYAHLTLFFIFEGDGRQKSSVMRSLKSFDKQNPSDSSEANWWANGLKLLKAIALKSVLWIVMQTEPHNIFERWMGNCAFNHTTITYLRQRLNDGVTDEALIMDDPANRTIQNLRSGLDILGPGRSRKRAAEAPHLCGPAPPPLLRLTGPSSSTAPSVTSSNPGLQLGPPSEEANRLRELLAWEGALSDEQAAEKAAKLIELLREVFEENYVHRITAASRRAEDAKNVCLLPSPLLALHP